MGNLLPPPDTNSPLVQDRKDPGKVMYLTATWRKFIIDLVGILNKSGGTSGSVPGSRTIGTTSPLAGGGDLTANRTLTFVPAGINGDVQKNNAGVLGSVTGISVTITTAKLTTLGANGSMTFTNGVLTAQTQAT